MSRFNGSLEKEYNIPTVSLANENVVDFGINAHAKYTTGMPLRFVGMPYPFTGLSEERLKNYLKTGKDNVTGKPVMTAIIDALITPLSKSETNPEAPPEPRFLKPDTEENLRRLFKDRSWTDYNPIILPTEERVTKMLEGTSHDPNEIVKEAAGTFGTKRPFTVEKVAIIGVMAGAKPEYMPVLLALASQVPYMDSTTSSSRMVVINGPIREEIGVNSGIGALGPNAEANSIIGRSMVLFHKILQGYKEGESGFSSLSNPLLYNNLTIAENEENLPEGWKPFHVQKGFNLEDSTITVFFGWNFVNCSGSVVEHYAPQLMMRDFTRVLAATGGATLIMDPSVADLLRDTQGFKTKEEFSKWLSDNAEIPAKLYWANSIVSGMQGPDGVKDYKNIKEGAMLKHMKNPASINSIVVGGETASVWFITDFMSGRPVSIDAWR